MARSIYIYSIYIITNPKKNRTVDQSNPRLLNGNSFIPNLMVEVSIIVVMIVLREGSSFG